MEEAEEEVETQPLPMSSYGEDRRGDTDGFYEDEGDCLVGGAKCV